MPCPATGAIGSAAGAHRAEVDRRAQPAEVARLTERRMQRARPGVVAKVLDVRIAAADRDHRQIGAERHRRRADLRRRQHAIDHADGRR
jgi:hypothetical protein